LIKSGCGRPSNIETRSGGQGGLGSVVSHDSNLGRSDEIRRLGFVDTLSAMPFCKSVIPRPIPGSMVLTPGSSLGSYIVPTDQLRSFCAHFVLTHAHPRKLLDRSPIQIAPSQARLTWRFFRDRLPKKKTHLVGMDTLLILLSIGPGNHHPRGQVITIHPLRRPTSSSVNPNLGTWPLLATFMCLVSSYAMPCDHSGPTCAMHYIPESPSPHTPENPRGSALIPLVTPRPIPGPAILTPGISLGSYIIQ
jgi:hypothetical protein